MNWHSIGSSAYYGVLERFNYIREDAEYQGFKSYISVFEYVHTALAQDFEELSNMIDHEDIDVDYYEHEYIENEAVTYSVDIYVSDKFIDVIKELYPEDFI